MKLCIPVSTSSGLDSLVEPHLPRAEHLLFFDTDTRACQEVSLRGQPGAVADDLQMHAVLCGSINRVTLRTLFEQGVKVFGTDAQTAAQAIAQYENGELEAAVVGSGAGAGGGCRSGGHSHAEHGDGDGCHGSGGGCGGHGHDHQSGACCASQSAKPADATQKPAGDALRIAVCSQNRKTVTEHAGKCRKFWIYEVRHGVVAGKALLELPLEQSLHASPPHQPHPLDTVNVLLSAGMGSGLQQRLLQRGIQGVVTAETIPDLAVAAFLAGELEGLPPDRAWVAACEQESVGESAR